MRGILIDTKMRIKKLSVKEQLEDMRKHFEKKRIFKRKKKKEKMEQKTDIKCDICQIYMNIVDGWESEKALECPKCGQYHYFIGNIRCSKVFTNKELKELDEEKNRLSKTTKEKH